MSKPKIALKHQQGQWFATAHDVAARKAVGDSRIAILRLVPSAKWDTVAGVYSDFGDGERGTWWFGERASRAWRDALNEALAGHRLVAVRRYADGGSSFGTVGSWSGVYRLTTFEADDTRVVVRHEPGRVYEVVR